MSKFTRLFAFAALIVGALAMTPGPAAARGGHGGGWHGGGGHVGGGWHGGGYRGGWHGGGYRGGWHGGGYRGGWYGGGYRRGWYGGGGWDWAPGFVWGFGLPYYGGYYYSEPACGWVRVRVWRNHHRVWRRVWRCW
jgi:hypothetical protein